MLIPKIRLWRGQGGAERPWIFGMSPDSWDGSHPLEKSWNSRPGTPGSAPREKTPGFGDAQRVRLGIQPFPGALGFFDLNVSRCFLGGSNPVPVFIWDQGCTHTHTPPARIPDPFPVFQPPPSQKKLTWAGRAGARREFPSGAAAGPPGRARAGPGGAGAPAEPEIPGSHSRDSVERSVIHGSTGNRSRLGCPDFKVWISGWGIPPGAEPGNDPK